MFALCLRATGLCISSHLAYFKPQKCMGSLPRKYLVYARWLVSSTLGVQDTSILFGTQMPGPHWSIAPRMVCEHGLSLVTGALRSKFC